MYNQKGGAQVQCETLQYESEPTFKLPLVVKAFWQTLHTNGRSPVCVRMWICSDDVELKFFWHM